MKIYNNFSLKNYNTFGIEVNAEEFISVTSTDELKEVLHQKKNIFVLGGGSNMLLTQDIEKTVLHINIKGIESKTYDENHVIVTANAGENWHEFVLWCIDKNYGGLENLSLIPGNVGTSPIQNIGAYGVEIKDSVTALKALNLKTLELETFTNTDCAFGYRDSVFKNKLKGQYIIVSVSFKLTSANHKLNTSYGAIETELQSIETPTIKHVSDAVIKIRNSKLPNPKEIGNSGSFFKNPVIGIDLFEKLKINYPEIPSYPVSDSQIKVPAGWLIEKAGFKGQKYGDYGVHEKQALVLVNYGNAKGKDIHLLAQKIQQTIQEKFGISLEIEVNVI